MNTKPDIKEYIANYPIYFSTEPIHRPWELTANLPAILEDIIPTLGSNFKIKDGIAIHASVTVEEGVTIKRPFIAMENCQIRAHAYFREGVFLDRSVRIGPGCEIKSSIICSQTAIAHLNYIGNSIIGNQVNFEAGAIAANHYNERKDREIRIKYKDVILKTGVHKFGALVGDYSRIGANAVLSPGTLLEKYSVVKRLGLVEQVTESEI